jgi:hypothetical protein
MLTIGNWSLSGRTGTTTRSKGGAVSPPPNTSTTTKLLPIACQSSSLLLLLPSVVATPIQAQQLVRLLQLTTRQPQELATTSARAQERMRQRATRRQETTCVWGRSQNRHSRIPIGLWRYALCDPCLWRCLSSLCLRLSSCVALFVSRLVPDLQDSTKWEVLGKR